MHTGLSSQVKGFDCIKRNLEEIRSGRPPDRTIRRQTGLARRSRWTGILVRVSAGRRIHPVHRRTPGEASGDAGLTAGPSGAEAGGAGLIVGFAAECSFNGQISTYL
jgi:hypothetical protein